MSVLDEAGITWVWGCNKKGELGLGDCTPRQNPYPLLSIKEKGLTHVKVGNYFQLVTQLRAKRTINEANQKFSQYLAASMKAKLFWMSIPFKELIRNRITFTKNLKDYRQKCLRISLWVKLCNQSQA